MKFVLKTLLSLACLTLVACTDGRTRVQGYYAFYVPSSNYKVGQVWSIWTKPPKINIVLQSQISEAKLLIGTAPNLTVEQKTKLAASASADLKEQLTAKLGLDSSKTVSQKYENVKEIQVTTSDLSESLRAYFAANPHTEAGIRAQLTKKQPVLLEVATHILVADVVFTVDKSLVASATGDIPKVVQGMDLGLSVKSESSSKVTIEGKGLPVAYHTDPTMVKEVLGIK